MENNSKDPANKSGDNTSTPDSSQNGRQKEITLQDKQYSPQQNGLKKSDSVFPPGKKISGITPADKREEGTKEDKESGSDSKQNETGKDK